MKTSGKLMLLLVSLIVFTFQRTNAQSLTNDKKNELKFGPFHPMLGSIYVSYERIIERNAIVINQELSYQDTENKYINGFMSQIQYRRYFEESIEDFNGALFYIGPLIRYKESNNKEAGINSSIYSYGFDFLLGLKQCYSGRFVVDLSVGFGIQQSDIDSERMDNVYNKNYLSVGYSGIMPRLDFTIGFMF